MAISVSYFVGRKMPYAYVVNADKKTEEWSGKQDAGLEDKLFDMDFIVLIKLAAIFLRNGSSSPTRAKG